VAVIQLTAINDALVYKISPASVRTDRNIYSPHWHIGDGILHRRSLLRFYSSYHGHKGKIFFLPDADVTWLTSTYGWPNCTARMGAPARSPLRGGAVAVL
jgi:hypothetical protein